MYQYGGYVFETEEQAQQAKREAEGVRYIKAQTRMDDPEIVLKLYNKLLKEDIFETEIGLGFLGELQEYLRTIPYIKNEDIRPIPARVKSDEPRREEKQAEKRKKRETAKGKKREKTFHYKTAFHITLFLAVVFAAAIIGMFTIIYLSGNNTNIMNYENEIIDKYEKWEMELKDREEELDQRESELEQREAMLEERMEE